MSEPSARYACTLDTDAARARLPQARALTSRLRSRERFDDRLVLRFSDDGDTTTIVDQFVRDEQQCCAFFGFDVRHDADEVVLELSAPGQAAHILDAAMASFDPALDDDARLAVQQRHATAPASEGCSCCASE